MRNNYIKSIIENTQQNSKCRLCVHWDGAVNHIGQRTKLVQKENKVKPSWMGKVIHWESDKIIKFDHTTEWYMRKQQSLLQNEAHKILLDFEIETKHLIPTGGQDLVLTRKKNL